MVGIGDAEALMPRTRPTFEGYRLLREYFMMPERFHYARVQGCGRWCANARPAWRSSSCSSAGCRNLPTSRAADLELFVTPIINLFERECNVIEIDRRKTRQILHADRTRPRDFEIYRVTRVEDADIEGPDAEVPALFSLGQNRGNGWVYSIERRPRRATEDERRQGMTRTSYTGDDVFLAVSSPADRPAPRPLKRLDVVALCTNRDLPILDDNPTLSLESGDPVESVKLLSALRPPQPAVRRLAAGRRGGRVAGRRVGMAHGLAACAQFPQPRSGGPRRRSAACAARPLRGSRRSGAGAPCAFDRPHRNRGR